MGTITTEYAINLRYMMQNRPVVTGAQQMTKELRQAEVASSGLSSSLGKIGTVVAGYFGAAAGKRVFVDFNSDLEQAKITMAGLWEQSKGGDFASNFEKASELVKQMQLDAKTSIGTTKDFVQMSSMLVQPIAMAGGSMETLRDLTKQTVVASRSMGIEAGVAARDIDQAIRGVYRSVDPFSGKVLTAIGYGGEEGRKKFNALAMEQRLAEVKRGLSGKWLQDMAKAQGESYQGVLSTLQDNLMMAFGKVGMPLFKMLTKEIRIWNTWLDKNQETIDHLVNVSGRKLLDVAITFRDAVAMAAKHWDKILVAWGGLKAAGYIAGGANGLLGGAAAAGSAGAPGKFGTAIASVSLVASAVYIGGKALADWIDTKQTAELQSGGRVTGGMAGLIRGMESGDMAKASALRQMLMASGLANNTGIDKGELARALSDAGKDVRKEWAGALGAKDETGRIWPNAELIADKMAKRFGDILTGDYIGKGGMLRDMHKWSMLDDINPSTSTAASKGTKVNVTINRIEVASDDPDRFAVGFTDWVRNVARNPANAMHAIREAG